MSELPTMTSPESSPGRGRSSSATSSDSFDHGRFAPGTLLGDRYRIVARLGVGGMGEVFRADDLKLGQPVALKFLPEAVERDPVRLDQFTAEVRIARQISHPNVCRVYDVGEIDGRRFLTMEYVDGEDLKGLLRRIGRLPEDKGLEIARQICAGLAAIHDRGVLHRDLKPANIMIDGRGRVRLTDFGLATTAAGAGTDGAIAGTPAYMAPEQFAGTPLSAATDLFAVGLVLFELFTGERGQKGDDIAAIRHGQQTRSVETLTTSGSAAKLDPLIQRVIARCLELDPTKRPPSAVTVAAALPGGDPLAAALAAGETPSPQMVAAAGDVGGLSLGIAAVLLAALVACVAGMYWQSGRTSIASLVTFSNSPEVLASKAREMIARLDIVPGVEDQAWGFVRDPSYLTWLDTHDTSATRWQHLASVRPAPIRFWYRSSRATMYPQAFFSGMTAGSPGGGLVITRRDPSMTTPGMTYIELDSEGRLVTLDVVSEATIGAARPARTPDWPALFREAGLDITRFVPATPEWVCPVASDTATAWTGTGADSTGAALRVEAATFRGRPVFFRLIAPWTPAPAAPIDSANAGAALAQWLSRFFLIGVPIAAIALSVRHVKAGRSDTRGAMRIALTVGGLTLAAGLLGSDRVTVVRGLSVYMIASWAAFSGLMIGTLYLSLEPYVRRRWPQMLIGWSRLLDGGWRDPLVGRDLLIGGLAGAWLMVVEDSWPTWVRWSGEPPMLAMPILNVWSGVRPTVADLLGMVPEAASLACGLVLLLVVVRLVVRSERGTAIAVIGLTTVAGSGGEFSLSTTPVILVLMGTMVVTATRFGLLACTTALLVGKSLAGGAAAPEFVQIPIWIVMAAMIAPGVFGFFTATRGRKHTAWLDA